MLRHDQRLKQQDELPFLHAVAGSADPAALVLAEIDRFEARQRLKPVIDIETLEFLAYIRSNAKQYDAATDLLQRLLKQDRSRRDLKLLLADMLYQAQRFRESETILSSLLNK